MIRRAAYVVAVVVLLLLTSPGPAAASHSLHPSRVGIPFGPDCKDSPAPDMPGEGLAAFFEKTPSPIPKQADPFKPGAKTTIYEQYGYAGLRWHTYDLGCGPDAARNPDAVIGTALSNWVMNIPLSFAALTSSVTEVAFAPTFLNIFDPAIVRVSDSLHRSLFATWVPVAIAILGVLILFRARRSTLSTTASAVGWALVVGLLATALFRWPVESGHIADGTVTDTLGTVVNGINGRDADIKPSTAVASDVQQSIFYRAWVAGELGSSDSATAKKFGPLLFKSQALSWHEAYVVQHDPVAGKKLIEKKKDDWERLASAIEDSDPAAYEHLTGKRSDTRLGYAILSTVAALLALPFLLVASLLLLGSFLIVRLAVMMFPVFGVLGVLPAGRGLVLGVGRTVGAALVNSVIFGIGAAVTIRVLGLILDPETKLPGWLALVLMPLFGFVMWMALKPFRRLTAMVSPNHNLFGAGAGALADASRKTGRWAKQATTAAAAAAVGNVAAAASVGATASGSTDVPERAEARPTPANPVAPLALPAPPSTPPSAGPPTNDESAPARQASATASNRLADRGREFADAEPLPPTEPEWIDGEEVYPLYRPTADATPGTPDAA